jgi:hypothetical protein
MKTELQNQGYQRERILAAAMQELASELRLVDVVEYVTYIRLEKFGHIENLVNSAAELFFADGAVVFGASAHVHLNWGSAPTIWLDMVLTGRGVTVHFCLVLASQKAGVEITYMTFDGPSANGTANTLRLVRALKAVTLSSRGPGGSEGMAVEASA